jgi:hypothetical protein
MANWCNVSVLDIRSAVGDEALLDIMIEHETADILEILQHLNLEQVEKVASQEKFIHSEKKVSELFDSYVEEMEEAQKKDKSFIGEQFGFYLHGLVQEDNLHPLQYNNYTYVGSFK